MQRIGLASRIWRDVVGRGGRGGMWWTQWDVVDVVGCGGHSGTCWARRRDRPSSVLGQLLSQMSSTLKTLETWTELLRQTDRQAFTYHRSGVYIEP